VNNPEQIYASDSVQGDAFGKRRLHDPTCLFPGVNVILSVISRKTKE
jgi:hypothetical protein